MATTPTKLRPGHRVQSVKTAAFGKVVSVRNTTVGEFVDVNFGSTKAPVMRACRPSQITKVR